jgi:chemotaxis-related protein WspD
MNTLPMLATTHVDDCWNRIGVRGDHSCPELPRVVHCHNCQVFSSAGRRFLDAPSPKGYLQEWTERLAQPIELTNADLCGVLIFRLGTEWLALPVQLLVEVTNPRAIHRVPHRGGILAGLTNIRGELHIVVHLDQVLGIDRSLKSLANRKRSEQPRMLLVQRESERWVFPVDEVDQVHRFALGQLTRVPATVERSVARLSRGVFLWRDGAETRAIGMLDEERLFATLKSRVK